MSDEINSFSQIMEKLKGNLTLQERLKIALDFMGNALRTVPKAVMRDFWMMKRECLTLFKQSMHPEERRVFWGEYSKLLDEAHQIQKLHDADSAFEVEQLQLAIDAMHKAIATFSAEDVPLEIDASLKIPGHIKELQKEIMFYQPMASRYFDLRKELLSMEIRLSQKNKLLADLGKMKDTILNRKRECIEKLSEHVTADVENFIETQFDMAGKSVRQNAKAFHLKGEIKRFQSMIRNLAVSSPVYRTLRERLSLCWDIAQKFDEEQEESKGREEKVHGDILSPIFAKMDALPLDNALKKALADCEEEAKKLRLPREGLVLLRKKTSEKLDAYYDKIRADEEKLQGERGRKHEMKLSEKNSFIAKIEALRSLTFDEKMKLEAESKSLPFSKDEWIGLEQQMALLVFKESHASLEKFGTDEIEDHLQKMEEFREKSERRLLTCKTEMQGCGLDLEKAMAFRNLIDKEESLLESLEELALQFEERIP